VPPPPLLAGRYDVGRRLAAGVHEAWDRVVPRRLSVRLADPHLTGATIEHARAASRLRHPCIRRVVLVGESDGLIWVLMEAAEGPVAAVLDRPGPELVVAIGAGVCRALAAAHGEGVLHGGLTLADIAAGPGGRVEVTGFGLTGPGAGRVPGLAPYLAPEVRAGGPGDDRSDLYGLGCCLYELLTGAPPGPGPLRFPPGVPGPLADAVTRALAPHPADRWQTPAELRRALSP
jgi:serine/threonine-protein kinase